MIDSASRWDFAKRVVDLVAGLSVIATMIFIALQWNEMRQGGKDTHDLAVQAGKQADAAKAQADQLTNLVTQATVQVGAAQASAEATRDIAQRALTQAVAANDLAKEAKRSANIAEEELRPYIWTTQNEPPAVKLGQKVAWNFRYTNFGKSPAIGVAPRCQVRLAAHNTPELKDMYAPIHVKGHEEEGFIVPPGDPSNWSTCFSEELITDADLKMMNTYDGGAKLVVFFEYYDTSGNRYTSKSCLFTRRPGAGILGVCPAEQQIR